MFVNFEAPGGGRRPLLVRCRVLGLRSAAALWHAPGRPIGAGGCELVDQGGEGVRSDGCPRLESEDPARGCDERAAVGVDDGGRLGVFEEHDIFRFGAGGAAVRARQRRMGRVAPRPCARRRIGPERCPSGRP